jgi:hypothetical protein
VSRRHGARNNGVTLTAILRSHVAIVKSLILFCLFCSSVFFCSRTPRRHSALHDIYMTLSFTEAICKPS